MNNEAQTLMYNFIFLFADADYWEALIGQELYHGEYSRVYKTAFDGSPLLQKLFHYHWSYSMNEKMQMPFKQLWFRKMYKQSFTNGLPLCFVFMGGNSIRFDAGFCDYIRKKDPRNKVVILHEDLISKKINYDYEEIREKADLAITYDLAESKKYHIEYFQGLTYAKLIPESGKTDFLYDIYFLGAAKDRLPQIMEAYHYFHSHGLKCKFIIAGVAIENQVQEEGIEYKYISYEENLRNLIQSSCTLEITQKGSTGITMRTLEAIAYKRKFITDSSLDMHSLFNDGQVAQYTKITDVPVEFLKTQYDPNEFSPKVDLDPMKRLYFIQQKLEEQ